MIGIGRSNQNFSKQEKKSVCQCILYQLHLQSTTIARWAKKKTKRKENQNFICIFALIEFKVVFSPAGLKAFEFLDEEGLQNLGALVEGRVAGVVVAAVVEDFGHVGYKLRQLDVLALL